MAASGRQARLLAAKVLKQVMVNTGGNKRQVPAKRQNRGSRNSTDDGG
ncbi:single-stranded DNA-binding protein [Escherichia coli]|nr:single-stranded DNA-binding protein [Escherichia coli]